MTKSDMLQAIKSAREIHKKQMDKIQNIIKGNYIDDPTALGKMECECGQWFYGNKDLMTKILGHQLFERLDAIHETWHKDYSRVYAIYQEQQKKQNGFLGKIFNSNYSALEYDKLKLYYKELSAVTDQLLTQTDVAIRRISALPESKFT
ncbi:MAG: CZB domain-containing protein [Campylobacterales bacterium]|nr:CZB domain-containing protein [Campylobacterales bacterium]